MSNCSYPEPVGTLQFRKDGSFKILQLTDMHYDTTQQIFLQNINITNQLIAAEQPDLVVFTGDTLSGWKIPEGYESIHNTIFGQLDVPFAVVLGNHDRESIKTPSEILCMNSQFLCSWTLKTPWVNSNQLDYLLPIYPFNSSNSWNDTDKSNVSVWLSMLDSGKNTCLGVKGNGCVEPSQLEWLESNLNSKPKLVFMHHPSKEYNDLYHYYTTFGYRFEASHCSLVDTGFYNTMERLKVNSVYVGHDHDNDYHGTILSTRLVYGRKTGYGSYGPNHFSRGARVIQVYENGNTDSWIRTTSGIEPQQIHQPQRLFLPCAMNPWIGMLYWLLPTLLISTVAITSFVIIKFCKRARTCPQLV